MKAFFPTRTAEIIFALIFAYFGFLHFKNAAAIGANVPAYFPGDGKIWVYLTGAAFVFAAIAIIGNFYKTIGCYLLAFVLIVFVLTIHIKNFSDNPSGTLKDLAIAMGAIIIGNRRK